MGWGLRHHLAACLHCREASPQQAVTGSSLAAQWLTQARNQ